MEIGPITGIRALPVMKVPPADPGLSAVFDIENSSKPGDDSYSGSRKQTAGGEDDDTENLEDGIESEPALQAEQSGPLTQIDYFA